VKAYKAKYGADRVTDDPIEAGYFGVVSVQARSAA
jgi:urea transport system substrate-binding protein